jgi:imidazoleglycerol-phosphate dehydratase
MRKTAIARNSKETTVKVELNLDGSGKYNIRCPINFLNHMLEAFAKHGLFDLVVEASGDTEIDEHHTVEDIGIVLGESFKQCLGDMKGINRAGFFAFPMDESLGIVAVDFSGRPHLEFRMKMKKEKVGDLESDAIREFFAGFSSGARCNVAVYVPYGENDHHKTEAVFKAFGKALSMACSINRKMKGKIPSTKGII